MQSSEEEISVVLYRVKAVTEAACAAIRCNIGFTDDSSRSLKIGVTTIVPSSPPEMRRDPSLVILRQEMGFSCAGSELSMFPKGSDSEWILPETPPAKRYKPSGVAVRGATGSGRGKWWKTVEDHQL